MATFKACGGDFRRTEARTACVVLKHLRATIGTLKDASIEFTVPNKSGDSAVGMLQALWASGTPTDVRISDVGGSLTSTCEVMNVNVNQNLAEAVSADVTLRPTQSSSGGGMNVGDGAERRYPHVDER
ncbi:MAG: hypothetical protein AAGJ40_19570 [Planctomycetota bacterium]